MKAVVTNTTAKLKITVTVVRPVATVTKA